MSAPGSGVKWRIVLGAVKNWYTQATGLEVAWAKQPKRAQNAKPFGTLYMSGGPYATGKNDWVTRKYNPATGLIERMVSGNREFVIQCQAFSDDVEHDGHARIYIDAAMAALNMPSVLADLSAADVAVVDVSQPTDLSDIPGTDWESRVSFDVRFRTSSNVEDKPVAPLNGAKLTLELDGTVSGNPLILPKP